MSAPNSYEAAYPKPWRIGFNGTIATVIAANGKSVDWEQVEAAMNRSSGPLGEPSLLDEALSCLAEVNWALKAYYMDLPNDRSPGPPKRIVEKINAVLKRADSSLDATVERSTEGV